MEGPNLSLNSGQVTRLLNLATAVSLLTVLTNRAWFDGYSAEDERGQLVKHDLEHALGDFIVALAHMQKAGDVDSQHIRKAAMAKVVELYGMAG